VRRTIGIGATIYSTTVSYRSQKLRAFGRPQVLDEFESIFLGKLFLILFTLQAQRLHAHEESNEVYVVVKVDYSLIPGRTRIAQTFIDPIKYLAEGRLSFSASGSTMVSWG
jgi:hypothetical protein